MVLEGVDYVIYFYCKGLLYFEFELFIILESVMLLIMIFRNVYVNVDILNIIVLLNKIGFGLGGSGWMWFNFYMCRVFYVKIFYVFVRIECRYYYESWLGDFLSDFEINFVYVLFRLSDGLSFVDLLRFVIGFSWDLWDIFNYVYKEKFQINLGFD